MDTAIFVGRILFSLIFVGSGLMGHLLQADQTAAYAESKGLPAAKPLVQLSGLAMLAGAAGVILGIWMDLAFLGLGILVLIIAVVMHPFWKYEGAEQQAEMPHFMKNLSIAGACLMMFGVVAGLGYDAVSITGPVIELVSPVHP
ncbi:MAG: DoxX family protein [Actinomyces sp.]|nr:MAG: DoxX family protein [Actinomyces sp.]